MVTYENNDGTIMRFAKDRLIKYHRFMNQDQQEMGKSNIRFEGNGPGEQTLDGCSVDFYLLLKPKDEPGIIAANVPAGSTILELGCGVGRITHPLIEMGYQVTAVDNSAEMLAHVNGDGAETVHADIETLNLGKQFDAVLLMSHMINIPDLNIRQAILQTCKRHLKEDGVVLIQCHNPAVWDQLEVGYLGSQDGIETYLDRLERYGSRLSVTIRWQANQNKWSQSFETKLLKESQLKRTLLEVGLSFDRWINKANTWILTTKSH